MTTYVPGFIFGLYDGFQEEPTHPGIFLQRLPHTVSAWEYRRGERYGKKMLKMLNNLVWLQSHREFLVLSVRPINKCCVCVRALY